MMSGSQSRDSYGADIYGADSYEAVEFAVEPFAIESAYAKPVQSVYEPTPATDAENITQVLGFLNTLLEVDSPENEQAILEIMAVLEDWLTEIPLAKD